MWLLAGTTLAHADSHRDSSPPDESFALLDIDTLLFIENRGVERLHFELNGWQFKLVTDPAEVTAGDNAFLVPRNGRITVHIGRYIHAGDGNWMRVQTQGPLGTDVDIVVANTLLEGETVAYVIRDLAELPVALTLFDSYPNPFSESVHIRFAIPETRLAGLHIHLEIFDVTGRRVVTLLDDVRYPGTLTLTWDGTSADGSEVPAGLYLCRMRAGGSSQTIRLIRVRR